MKYSFKDITKGYTKEKRKRSSFWARCVSRPFSFPITYVLINMGVSADAVSFISMLVALASCVMIVLGGVCAYIGVGLFVLWHILDCVDGNIARTKGESSYGGAFLDAVSGYIAPAFIFLAVGTNAFLTSDLLGDYSYLLIVMGGASSASDILSRIVYQKYLVTEYRLGVMEEQGTENIDQVRSSGLYHFADLIMKQMSYSSMFMPLLIICTIIGRCDLLTMLYFLYTFGVLIVTVLFFCRKAKKLDSLNLDGKDAPIEF